MAEITVDVWLYGALARYGGPDATRSFANLSVRIAEGTTLGELLEELALPAAERGITFIDGQLSAMPGLQPDLDHTLRDGMRIGMFDLKSMWPFQYRHGASMIPELARAMDDQALHHTYE
jgi:hypothetical protein